MVARPRARIHYLPMTNAMNTDTWTDGLETLTVTQLNANSYRVSDTLGLNVVATLADWRKIAARRIEEGYRRVPTV